LTEKTRDTRYKNSITEKIATRLEYQSVFMMDRTSEQIYDILFLYKDYTEEEIMQSSILSDISQILQSRSSAIQKDILWEYYEKIFPSKKNFSEQDIKQEQFHEQCITFFDREKIEKRFPFVYELFFTHSATEKEFLQQNTTVHTYTVVFEFMYHLLSHIGRIEEIQVFKELLNFTSLFWGERDKEIWKNYIEKLHKICDSSIFSTKKDKEAIAWCLDMLYPNWKDTFPEFVTSFTFVPYEQRKQQLKQSITGPELVENMQFFAKEKLRQLQIPEEQRTDAVIHAAVYSLHTMDKLLLSKDVGLTRWGLYERLFVHSDKKEAGLKVKTLQEKYAKETQTNNPKSYISMQGKEYIYSHKELVSIWLEMHKHANLVPRDVIIYTFYTTGTKNWFLRYMHFPQGAVWFDVTTLSDLSAYKISVPQRIPTGAYTLKNNFNEIECKGNGIFPRHLKCIETIEDYKKSIPKDVAEKLFPAKWRPTNIISAASE
jgi:hypothetical protein